MIKPSNLIGVIQMKQIKLVGATKTAILAGQYSALCSAYAAAVAITLTEIDMCDANASALTGILFEDMARAAISGMAKIDLVAPFQDANGAYLARASGVSYKSTISGYARAIELALANGVPLIVKDVCRPVSDVLKAVEKFRAKTNGGRAAKAVEPVAPVAPTVDALKLAETIAVTVPLVGRVFDALGKDTKLRDGFAAEIRALFAMLSPVAATKPAPHVDVAVEIVAPVIGAPVALVVSKGATARRQVNVTARV